MYLVTSWSNTVITGIRYNRDNLCSITIFVVFEDIEIYDYLCVVEDIEI